MNYQEKSKDELIKYILKLEQDLISFKKSAEEELKKEKDKLKALSLSEENFQLLFNKAPLGYQSLDFDGNFIDVNQQWFDTLGYQREEVIGKWFGDFLTPAYRDGFRKRFPLFKAQGHIHSEFEMIHKNGSHLFIAFDGRIGYNSKGEFKQTHCILQDITEKKRAENALRESEEKYRLLHENAGIGIGYYKLDGTIISYNNIAAKNMNGLAEDFNGKSIYDIFPDKNARYYHERIKKAAVSEIPEVYEDEVSLPTTKKYFLSTFTRIINLNGEIDGIQILSQDITDRKNAEKALKESNERFDYAMDASTEGLFDWNLLTNEIYYAPTWKKILGYEDNELPNDFSVWENLTEPEDVKKSWELQQKLVSGQIDRFVMEFKMKHKQGYWVDILSKAKAIFDDNGKAIRIVGTHTDITESKLLEALLNNIIEKNPMSIQIVDREGHTLRYNRAFIELFGSVPPPEFSIFDDLINKSAELETLVLKVKDGEIVHLPDIYFNAHDEVSEAPDIPLWIRALIFPLKDSGGKPERFVFMHENITERKIAENNLKESELKYRSLIESSSDAIFCVDKTGKYVFTNQLFASTFNKTPEFFIGKTFWDVYDKEHADYRFEASSRLFRTGLSETIEVDVPLKDQTLYFLATTNPIKDEKGNVILNLTHATDITRLKIVEKELQKAKEKAEENDRLKSAFLANMSHEIRTPMNGILGFAELLKEPELTGEQQQKYVKIIEKSGSRMLNIINDIIDISKIEAGLMKVDLKESNVNEQIEYIYTFFKPEVENKGMQLIINNKLKANEAIVYTDREKLYAIFTNLVKNAVKYSYNGFIEIGCSLSVSPINANGLQNVKANNIAMTSNGKELQFYVKDSGIGISKDRHQAIFERFVQADIDDKMARQGAGLGLAITKSYVEMLGGKIWLESDEGAGSCFYFTLPFNAKTAEKTVSEESSATINNYTYNLKILIAEDDETSEILLSIFAETYCREIIKVKNGKEAIETCRRIADIDLILMDIQMPEIGGYEATKQIRKFNKNVVIIAQTAFGLYGDKEKAIEAGCNDYLSKPIDKMEFENLIYKYFDNKCSLK